MAVTQNTYTGDGATVLFSFTFPYLETSDIKVSVDGTITTEYSLANATTIEFDEAPADDADIRIFRETDDATLAATFYPGSAIRSQDLNENFTQNLYVTQESNRNAFQAIDTADGATATANTALTNSETAIDTADSAVVTANNAVDTADSAVVTANSAVVTSNIAASDAAAAVTTANAADVKADQAIASVSAAVLFDLVANVAAIPASPANDDYIEVGDSTGIESFTPLSSLPSGFTGDPGLTVRLRYTSTGSTWNFLSYFANNSETRYLKVASAASQAEAEAGTENSKYLTSLRVAQAIAALSPGGGATGGGDDQVFVENEQVVTASYTLPVGKNASSVGPVSLDAGVTVTISANSTWVIL